MPLRHYRAICRALWQSHLAPHNAHRNACAGAHLLLRVDIKRRLRAPSA